MAEQITNPLGHIVKQTYDAATGAQLTRTDPNQLTVTRIVDGFGQTLVECHPDGNEVRSYVKSCQNDADCPANAALVKISLQTHGSAANSPLIASPSFVYFDLAGHESLNSLGGFDGSWVISEKKYDHLGRLFETYQARFERDAAILASRQIYDDLGRVKKVTVFDRARHIARRHHCL